MTHAKRFTRLVSLLAVSGLAAGAYAQVQDTRTPRDSREGVQRIQETQRTQWQLSRASKIMGTDIENAAAENIGEIEDLVIERGTGRITHAVITSGGIAGIGAKKIAVPFGRLTYNTPDEKFLASITEGEIESAPEFKAEEWSSVDQSSWMDGVRDVFTDDEDYRDHADDSYREPVTAGERETISGNVTAVHTGRDNDGREQVIIAIDTDDGDTRTVLVGPAWYINGNQPAICRDDNVTLTVVPLDNAESGADFVATTLERDGRTLTLREDDGQGVWSRSDETRQDRTASSWSRLMLLSELIGAEADLAASDDPSGEIQDAVIDRRSGQVVLVAFDPNDNLFGIADDLKLVPWPVLRVMADGSVRLDATEAMIRSAEVLPDDLHELENPGEVETVHRGFDVKFEAPRDRTFTRRP